jgi:hypothetical protein
MWSGRVGGPAGRQVSSSSRPDNTRHLTSGLGSRALCSYQRSQSSDNSPASNASATFNGPNAAVASLRHLIVHSKLPTDWLVAKSCPACYMCDTKSMAISQRRNTIEKAPKLA